MWKTTSGGARYYLFTCEDALENWNHFFQHRSVDLDDLRYSFI